MKISIVTISYNQAEFLERAIVSVIEQDFRDFEYIVVDPGSTDGSREIIERYRAKIRKIIYEPDGGPADGLNKGFAHADGEIYGFINSDDFILPGTLSAINNFFSTNTDIDVVSGHALVVDKKEKVIRKFYSDNYNLLTAAYSAAALAQQSTFFRSKIFDLVGGFNTQNTVAWDGELFIDMAMAGAKFSVVPKILSAFRMHPGGITSSGRLADSYKTYRQRVFYKIMGREPLPKDRIVGWMLKFIRFQRNPKDFIERLAHGPIGGRHSTQKI